jgi:hypothetical protein
VPERLMPVACLCLAALVACAAARLRWVLVALLLVVVAADLRVSVYDAAAAARGTGAYRGLSAPGRLLELPVLNPDVHLGSIYLWYDQTAQRERPGGYSTIAPRPAARLALRLSELNCGDWRRGTDALLRRLDIRYVAFHRGLSGDREWFGWRELLRHGFGQVARDDGVTMLERGRSGGSSPVPEPTKRVVFCENWRRGSPRYSRAALWANGPVRLRLSSSGPVRASVSVDGAPVHTGLVKRPVVLRLGARGWHLIVLRRTGAANGLRATVTP